MNQFDEDYYHGLGGPYPTNNVKETIELSLLQLEQIIMSGGLYSKSMREGKEISTLAKPVYNGDDYICICVRNVPNEELSGINEGLDTTYNKYVVNKLAIVIDKRIESECEFRKGDYDRFPGERQVKDKIGIEYFKAIRVGYEHPFLRDIICEKVNELLEKYNLDIPVIDCNDELVKYSKK